MQSGSIQDVAALVQFPRIVLAPLHREGQRHQGKAATIVKERLERWAGGDRSFEDEEHLSRPSRPRPKVDGAGGLSDVCRRRVLLAVHERNLSKACKLLLSAELPPVENAEAGLRAR